jgi:hypothetical protein|nr:MAG TPA_asm: hypothetical protein [Caudoviricetes sp.]
MGRIRDIFDRWRSIVDALNNPNISYGRQDSLLKSKMLSEAQIKHYLNRASKLISGTFTVVSIVKEDGVIYKKIYCNMDKDDIILHIKLMNSLLPPEQQVEILEIKNYSTDNLYPETIIL